MSLKVVSIIKDNFRRKTNWKDNRRAGPPNAYLVVKNPEKVKNVGNMLSERAAIRWLLLSKVGSTRLVMLSGSLAFGGFIPGGASNIQRT